MARKVSMQIMRKNPKKNNKSDSLSGKRDSVLSILYILGFIFLYRFGCYLPIPFIDTGLLDITFSQYSNQGILGMFNTMSGGALLRMSVFALSVFPYISASIIMQLIIYSYKFLQDIQNRGPEGSQQVAMYTKILAVFIGFIQGYGMASLVISITAGSKIITIDNVFHFKLITALTFTTGSMILIWVGESITKFGFGNGISIIIYIGIIADFPSALSYFIDISSSGIISLQVTLIVIILMIFLISLTVIGESSKRIVRLQYPGNVLNSLQQGAMSPSMPIKLNVCGVIPAIFASVMVNMPLMFLNFMQFESPYYSYLISYISYGSVGYSILFGILIVIFSFYYLPIAFKVDNIVEGFKRRGIFIQGYRPGNSTKEFLDNLSYRMTIFGSIYLVIICVIPQLILSNLSISFQLNGTSILIAVSVSLDILQNIYSSFIMQKYDKLM